MYECMKEVEESRPYPKGREGGTVKEQAFVYKCSEPSVVVVMGVPHHNTIILTLQMFPCPREKVVKDVEGSLLFGLANCT